METTTPLPIVPGFEKANFDVIITPIGNAAQYGTVRVQPKNFDDQKPVTVILVQLGLGTTTGNGSYEDLHRMITWPALYNKDKPSTDCLLNSVVKNDLVLVFVQTTPASAYRNGETDYLIAVADANYRMIGKPIALLLSLGGYGFLQWVNTVVRAADWFRVIFISPGGDGNVGGQFAALAAKAEVECIFYHSKYDPTANVKQSIVINAAIKAAGGKSELVEYAGVLPDPKDPTKTIPNAIHVLGFPMNAYYPPVGWKAYDNATFKLDPTSFVPEQSIYAFALAPQNVKPDTLLLTQQIWQRSDGSTYTKVVPPAPVMM